MSVLYSATFTLDENLARKKIPRNVFLRDHVTFLSEKYGMKDHSIPAKTSQWRSGKQLPHWVKENVSDDYTSEGFS